MSAQSEARRFPFPPSPVPYSPGPEMQELMAKCPVNQVPVCALTEPDEQIRDAAASCPVEAILLTDADTGKPVPLDD